MWLRHEPAGALARRDPRLGGSSGMRGSDACAQGAAAWHHRELARKADSQDTQPQQIRTCDVMGAPDGW